MGSSGVIITIVATLAVIGIIGLIWLGDRWWRR